METYFVIMISVFVFLLLAGLAVLAWGSDKTVVESYKGTCPACGRNIYDKPRNCLKCGHPFHEKCFNPEQCIACTRKPPA